MDNTIDKGSGILYFSDEPGTTPSNPSTTSTSEVAINTTPSTPEIWVWSRTNSEWVRLISISQGQDIPTTAPATGEPRTYIRTTTGAIYVYNGSAWVELGAGGGGGTDDQTAVEVPFTPTGNILSSDVQSMGEELQTQIDAIQAAFGISNGAQNLGSFSGSTISDNTTTKAALQELETAVESASGGVSDGDKGDVTVSASGATWTIDNDVINTDKIADNAVTLDKLANTAIHQVADLTALAASTYPVGSIVTLQSNNCRYIIKSSSTYSDDAITVFNDGNSNKAVLIDFFIEAYIDQTATSKTDLKTNWQNLKKGFAYAVANNVVLSARSGESKFNIWIDGDTDAFQLNTGDTLKLKGLGNELFIYPIAGTELYDKVPVFVKTDRTDNDSEFVFECEGFNIKSSPSHRLETYIGTASNAGTTITLTSSSIRSNFWNEAVGRSIIIAEANDPDKWGIVSTIQSVNQGASTITIADALNAVDASGSTDSYASGYDFAGTDFTVVIGVEWAESNTLSDIETYSNNLTDLANYVSTDYANSNARDISRVGWLYEPTSNSNYEQGLYFFYGQNTESTSNSRVVIKNCTFENISYPIYKSGNGVKGLLENVRIINPTTGIGWFGNSNLTSDSQLDLINVDIIKSGFYSIGASPTNNGNFGAGDAMEGGGIYASPSTKFSYVNGVVSQNHAAGVRGFSASGAKPTEESATWSLFGVQFLDSSLGAEYGLLLPPGNESSVISCGFSNTEFRSDGKATVLGSTFSNTKLTTSGNGDFTEIAFQNIDFKDDSYFSMQSKLKSLKFDNCTFELPNVAGVTTYMNVKCSSASPDSYLIMRDCRVYQQTSGTTITALFDPNNGIEFNKMIFDNVDFQTSALIFTRITPFYLTTQPDANDDFDFSTRRQNVRFTNCRIEGNINNAVNYVLPNSFNLDNCIFTTANNRISIGMQGVIPFGQGTYAQELETANRTGSTTAYLGATTAKHSININTLNYNSFNIKAKSGEKIYRIYPDVHADGTQNYNAIAFAGIATFKFTADSEIVSNQEDSQSNFNFGGEYKSGEVITCKWNPYLYEGTAGSPVTRVQYLSFPDGARSAFKTGGYLSNQPIIPGTVTVTLSNGLTFTDDENGGLVGSGGNGAINYLHGTFQVTLNDPVVGTVTGDIQYTQYTSNLEPVGRWELISQPSDMQDGLPEYADEAAAVTGGLESGRLYRTSTGEVRVKL